MKVMLSLEFSSVFWRHSPKKNMSLHIFTLGMLLSRERFCLSFPLMGFCKVKASWVLFHLQRQHRLRELCSLSSFRMLNLQKCPPLPSDTSVAFKFRILKIACHFGFVVNILIRSYPIILSSSLTIPSWYRQMFNTVLNFCLLLISDGVTHSLIPVGVIINELLLLGNGLFLGNW